MYVYICMYVYIYIYVHIQPVMYAYGLDMWITSITSCYLKAGKTMGLQPMKTIGISTINHRIHVVICTLAIHCGHHFVDMLIMSKP